MPASPPAHDHARVRTFRPRRRRLSPTRQRLLDELGVDWLVPPGEGQVDPNQLFGTPHPVVLDIGIGSGESCVEMAVADATHNIIGADVHTPGVAAALAAIDEQQISNLRLYHGDVFDLLGRLPSASLVGIRAFFPDPWPKARHHRRRLITDDRLTILADALEPGGWLHIATDIADYAEQVIEVCARHPELDGGVIERPSSRPVTRFEDRGVRAGREIVDLWYWLSTG